VRRGTLRVRVLVLVLRRCRPSVVAVVVVIGLFFVVVNVAKTTEVIAAAAVAAPFVPKIPEARDRMELLVPQDFPSSSSSLTISTSTGTDADPCWALISFKNRRFRATSFGSSASSAGSSSSLLSDELSKEVYI
jgi:hypothetical protein